MAIRMLAADLYRLIRAVEELEKKIEKTPYDQQAPLKDQLRKLKAERNYVRGLLDGRKGSS